MREWIAIIESASQPELYHGSLQPIEQFTALSHFGTRRAAIVRAAYHAHKQDLPLDTPLYLHKVSAQLNNTLRIPDLAQHNPLRVIDYLHYDHRPSKERITREERSEAMRYPDDLHGLATILHRKKIDALRYHNAHEDAGSESFMITRRVTPSSVETITLGDALAMLRLPLTEANIPNNEYGYWITDEGEFLPVPHEAHNTIARTNGAVNTQEALRRGWIRIIDEQPHSLSINYMLGALKTRAISALKRLAGTSDYRLFRVAIDGDIANPQIFTNRVFNDIQSVMNLISRSSSAGMSSFDFNGGKTLQQMLEESHNPNVVRVYHGDTKENARLHAKMFFSSDPTFAKDYGKYITAYDLNTVNFVDSLDRDLIEPLLPLYDPYDDIDINHFEEYLKRSSDTWEIIESHADQIVADTGADGIIVYEGGVTNYYLFNLNALGDVKDA